MAGATASWRGALVLRPLAGTRRIGIVTTSSRGALVLAAFEFNSADKGD